jgi:hypothetical protein
MGVGVSCPKCSTTFAFCCENCSSYSTEILKGFVPEKYFKSRTAFYLKCRTCQAEYDYALCPDCNTRIFPTAPFVKGDLGESPKGCFIATACLAVDSRILKQLQVFRDELLARSPPGKKFIHYYYRLSPGPAAFISKSPVLQALARLLVIYPAYCISFAGMRLLSLLRR